MKNVSIGQRISGGLIGLLVGDALGTPYEFKHASMLPASEEIEMTPPAGFERSHARVSPGTWSDDGAQALCLAASLLERKQLDPEDFAKRMDSWYCEGYMAVDGRVFDCGHTTSEALERFREGEPAISAGGDAIYENGNGSLMRVLPLALWHRGSMEDLIDAAELQSKPTHRHPISLVCCALYSVTARLMLFGASGDDATWKCAESILAEHYKDRPEFLEALEGVQDSAYADEPEGSGFVVDQIWTCRRLLEYGTYEEGVRAGIAMGNDTDTTACIAGGLLGIREGIDGIPQIWREALRGQDLVAPVLAGLQEQEVNKPLEQIGLPDGVNIPAKGSARAP